MWYLVVLVNAICILISWGVAYSSLLGWGALFSHLLGLRAFQRVRIETSFWFGLVFVALATQVLHFYAQVTIWTGALLCGVGLLAGLLPLRRQFVQYLNRCRQAPISILGLTSLLLLRAAWDSASYVPQVDGYHFTSILWVQAAPCVMGLGNLEGRLAFTSTATLLQALTAGVGGQISALGNIHGALIIASFLAFLRESSSRRSANQLHSFASLGSFLLAIVACSLPRAFYAVGGVSPDLFAAFLAAATIKFSLLFWHQFTSRGQFNNRTVELAALVLVLSGLLLTAKFSMIALSGGCVALILETCISAGDSKSLRKLIAPSLLASCLVGCWMVRSIVLSGFLVYPIAATRLELSWSVPASKAVWEESLIREWAHNAGNPDSDSLWAWLNLRRGRIADLWCPLAMACVAAGLMVVKRRSIFSTQRPVLMVLVWLATIAFWAWTAPDPRFVVGQLYGGLSLLFGLAMTAYSASFADRTRWWIIGAVLVCAQADRLFQESERRGSANIKMVDVFGLAPPNEHGWYAFPPGELRQLRQFDGVVLHYSEYGWTAPLVSTTRTEPWNLGLRLRQPSSVFGGFRDSADNEE